MSKYVSGTRFQHITIHGMSVPRTAFGDGFDTGDILIRDRRTSNGQPEFLVVISRNGTDVSVAQVGTITCIRNLDDETALFMPAIGVTVQRTLPYRIHDGFASYPDGSGVARPWDGRDVPQVA